MAFAICKTNVSTASASVPYEYFNTEVKPAEKIPHRHSLMHIRHYMLNGVYMDAKVPSESFVNHQLAEGLCSSFGVERCPDLCEGFNVTNIHVNLLSLNKHLYLSLSFIYL